MPSLVRELQKSAQDSSKSVSDLLRMVKVIASKLDLPEIGEWVESELNGYSGSLEVASYRTIQGGELMVLHPIYGWRLGGHLNVPIKCRESVARMEILSRSRDVGIPLARKGNVPMQDEFGVGVNDWPQQIKVDSSQLLGMLDAVRNKILDWSLELEKRGITGENMSFKEEERQTAAQNITIQNFKGVLGSVSNSRVEIHDYSTIHQELRDRNVPQAERNEIETILDDLKKANPSERPGLIERGKAWIVKNQEFLGASATIVRKALGFPESAG